MRAHIYIWSVAMSHVCHPRNICFAIVDATDATGSTDATVDECMTKTKMWFTNIFFVNSFHIMLTMTQVPFITTQIFSRHKKGYQKFQSIVQS